MANRKVDKAEAVEKITKLRAEGESIGLIANALGLSTTQVDRYIAAFKIKRGKRPKKCPHCGVAIEVVAR